MLSQSPVTADLIGGSGSGTGLFKRRNALWKIDACRAGSVPDVPETKKLMAFPMTVSDGSSLSHINQYATQTFSSPNKSKLSVLNRKEGKWGDLKDYKPR